MSGDSDLICYVPRNFAEATLATIRCAVAICDEYREQGLTLTLRQLYYQFVARGVISNDDRSYARLGSVVSDARLAGLLGWEAIEDRTRFLRGLATTDSVSDALAAVTVDYRRDLWADQPWRPEIWIEKDALVGVIEGICHTLRVDFFACRGYSSQSEQWRAGRRLAGYIARGQRPIVFHLGDHDPSGLDMTRDNRDRLATFAGVPVQVTRLALNRDQIDSHRPPPNPAKLTDSRAAAYVAEHGSSSWELDALDPMTLRDLIRDAVLRIRDEALWDRSLAEEAEDRRELEELAHERR